MSKVVAALVVAVVVVWLVGALGAALSGRGRRRRGPPGVWECFLWRRR